MIQMLNALPLYVIITAALGATLLINGLVWLWRSRKEDVGSKCTASVMMVGIYALLLWILKFV